ncbi:FHA domain-containing protein, partial [Vibrio cholerae]|nr:FHA domain-containing protein [Vibrio cholerae]
GTGPLVLARLCVAGHANAPTSSACAVCGEDLQAETQRVRRPNLGVMRISTGEVVDLDRSLVIGRQPSVSRVQGKEMPRLVQVQSESGDISRSHVEVRLDGWHVMLCDLKATNGTVLIREGQPPRRLGQGETAFLLDGDIAQLGDDVSLRFEDLP